MSSPPYILLFTPHSPVICKDHFPLVYMYKSSRYYLVFNINLGPMFPWSTILSLSLEIGSTAVFKYFGLYCQWLPGLTTKSIHYCLHSYYFRTRFTFIAQRILPLNAVLQYCATRPFGAQAHDTTVSRRPNSHDSVTHAHWLLIECCIQAATPIKTYFGSLYH